MSPGVRKLQNAALALLLGSISQAAMPLSMARTTGFLVGDPGALHPAGPEGADFTMAADGITIITVAWLDCFNSYGPGDFRLDMLAAPIIEDGGVSTTPDGTRLNLVTIPATFVDGCWYAKGFIAYPTSSTEARTPTCRSAESTSRRVSSPAGRPAIITVFVDFVRPPVVFVHGLWSELETWTFPFIANPVFPIKEFADKRRTVRECIRDQQAGCVRRDHESARALPRGGDPLHARRRCRPQHGRSLDSHPQQLAAFLDGPQRYHGNVRKLITLDTALIGWRACGLALCFAIDPTSQGVRMWELFESGASRSTGCDRRLVNRDVPIMTRQAFAIPARRARRHRRLELLAIVIGRWARST